MKEDPLAPHLVTYWNGPLAGARAERQGGVGGEGVLFHTATVAATARSLCRASARLAVTRLSTR